MKDNTTNLLAEQAVLGAILTGDKSSHDLIDKLDADDFTTKSGQLIFGACSKADADGKSIDVMIACEYLSASGELDIAGGMAEVTEYAMSYSDSSNIWHYYSALREASGKRALYKAGVEVSQLAGSDLTLQEATDKAQALMTLADKNSSESDARCFKSVVKDVLLRIDEASNRPVDHVSGIKTGWNAIDKRVDGWEGGKLYFVAGRPGMGKSIMGLNTAINMAAHQDKNVLIFSVEMPDVQLAQRSMAQLGDIQLSKITRGVHGADEESWPKIAAATEKLKRAAENISVVDIGNIHIRRLMSIARKQSRRKKVDFILVDHIHIVEGYGENEERRIASITGNLKSLSKELDCPVLALAQLSRGVEQRNDKKPMLSDLRGSGSIEQDGDVVQFLWRPEYYWPDDQDSHGWIEVITAKHRDGEVGTDYLATKMPMMSFLDQHEYFTPPQLKYENEQSKGRGGFRG